MRRSLAVAEDPWARIPSHDELMSSFVLEFEEAKTCRSRDALTRLCDAPSPLTERLRWQLRVGGRGDEHYEDCLAMQQSALYYKAAAPDENRVHEFFGLRLVDEVFRGVARAQRPVEKGTVIWTVGGGCARASMCRVMTPPQRTVETLTQSGLSLTWFFCL